MTQISDGNRMTRDMRTGERRRQLRELECNREEGRTWHWDGEEIQSGEIQGAK